MGRDGHLRWLHLASETLRFHQRTASPGENTARKRYWAQDSQGIYIYIYISNSDFWISYPGIHMHIAAI